MRSPVRRIQYAILEAVNILEEELSDDSRSEMDPDEIQNTLMVFDDLCDLLKDKGFTRQPHRARSQEDIGQQRGRDPQRSSSLPAPEPSPPSPKVSCKQLELFTAHEDTETQDRSGTYLPSIAFEY